MIRIPRTTLRALRRDIRRALGITSVKRAPAVTFRTTQDQLTIQAVTDHVAFEFRLPYETRFDDASECITVSNEVLRQCEGRTREIVTFEQRGDEIIVQWPDHSIPRVLTASASPPVPMPSVPGEFHVIQPQFLQAMTEASKTVSKETSRFAMDCIRLRGSDGQVAASDSHQVFTQTGFQFPWSDEVLVTSSPALQCSDFLHAPQSRSDEQTNGSSFDCLSRRWRCELKRNVGSRMLICTSQQAFGVHYAHVVFRRRDFSGSLSPATAGGRRRTVASHRGTE